MPFSYRERIEFENPKTMDETTRKEKLCFNLNKQKSDNSKNEKFNVRNGFQKLSFYNIF